MKVLIVKGAPASQKFLQEAVEAEKYLTRTAENGEMGLKTFKAFKPDFVFRDIQNM